MRTVPRDDNPAGATSAGVAWDELLRSVRANHPQLVRSWFQELAPAGIEQGVLTVEVGNDAQYRYLQEHCRRAFAEAAQSITGHLVSVAFHETENAETGSDDQLELADAELDLILNPDYTFDNFVTGPSNRLAHAAAIAVGDTPGLTYNPLFLHGSAGLGKTHLLQAICHTTREKHPGHSLLYLSCETFINRFIAAVERGALHEFRYCFRHLDVLAIDDIQFLAGHERTQEEFFHTFNALHQFRRQIILTADCAPNEIPTLEDRLVSRFNSGLVAALDRPSLETRVAILHKIARLRCYSLPAEVLQLIATRVDSNIRELQGALTRIDALSQALDRPITLALAREALGEAPVRVLSVPAIQESVAHHFGITVADLESKKRAQAITYPRHVAMYLARQLTPHSLEQIGEYFGGRDHTTVLHAIRAITHLAETDAQLRSLLDELTRALKNAR